MWELPTDRHTMMGTPVWTLVVSSLKLGYRVRAVDGAARRHVVDAVLEQEVDRERHVGRGRLGGDLLVERGQAALGVGAGPDPVHGHRPVPAGLEFLLAQRLELDRVLPVQRPRDLHGLADRIVPGGAVQPERPAGERDVHPDPVLVDSGGRRGRHPGIGGSLGADPHLEDAVVAHPAHGVVRLHRGVREVGQLVDRVHDVRRAPRARSSTSPSCRATTACSPDSTSRRCSASSSSELRRSAFCSSQSTSQREQAPLRVVERLADYRDALLDRDHRGDAGHGERRAVVDRGGRGAELGRVQHHRGQHPGQGDVDGEPGLAEDLPGRVDPERALAADELVRGPGPSD